MHYTLHITHGCRQLINKNDHLRSMPRTILLRFLNCLLVWRDRARRLATDPVVMRSSPATGHIIYLCFAS